MSEINVDRIVDDIVDNFKDITGYDVADVFNKNSDELVFNQDVIDKSIDSIKNYVSYNYDVDIIANEDILYALDAKLAEMHNRAIDAAESDNEDPDFIVNESTWAETEVEFSPIAQKKLEAILDANLFGDLGFEIDDNKLTSNIVNGIFTDRYRVAKKEYSNYSEDEIKAARKELFRIINKYYEMAKAEQPVNEANKSINESSEDKFQKYINSVLGKLQGYGLNPEDADVYAYAEGAAELIAQDPRHDVENWWEETLSNYRNDLDDMMSRKSVKEEYVDEDIAEEPVKQYIIFDNSNPDSSDNTRNYTKDEAIDLLKKILELEQLYLDETKLDYAKRSREDREFNFDLDSLSDDELVDWFKEFDFTVIDANECPAPKAAEKCFF